MNHDYSSDAKLSGNVSENLTKYIGERHRNDFAKNWSHTAKKPEKNHENFKYSSAKLMRRMASLGSSPPVNASRKKWASHRSVTPS